MKLASKNMSLKERYTFFHSQILKDGKIDYAGKILQKASQNYPQNIALVYKDRKVSYLELYQRACEFSVKLKDKGVCQGDVVLILFRNSIEFYVAYFAIWQIGAVVAPLNIYLKTPELKHIAMDSKAKLAVIDSQNLELFQDLHMPILTENDIDILAPINQDVKPAVIPEIDGKKMAALLYTSGTTGLPKGVMLSSENIMVNMAQTLSVIDFDESKSIYCVLPLFHCFAQNCCVWSSIFSASKVILVPKISRSQMLGALKHKPEIFLGVPALYGLLCLMKNAPIENVQYFISGGDALPDKIRQMFALIYGRKICNGYGLTETSPIISVDFEDLAQPTSTVGPAVQGMQVQIRNESGKVLQQGQIGELFVSGKNVMLGYYNEEKKTKEILNNGWLATGDMARLDEAGKIVICGRIKDLIAQKGVKIYPQEVENVILKHPEVISVGVVGQEDSVYGQVPVAFVALRQKVFDIQEQLRQLCMSQLAAYKVPRRFIVVEQMPMTATGKVDKNVLRKQI